MPRQAGGYEQRPWYKNPDIVTRIITEFLAGGVLIITAIIPFWMAKENLEVSITQPESGQEVTFYESVRATLSEKIGANTYLWVMTSPETFPDLWWPQSKINSSTGSWEKKTYIGRQIEDIGLKFNIAVIEVDANDNNSLIDYFISGKQVGSFPGIPLPDSANKITQITVKRK